MRTVDHIELRPDSFGWVIVLHDADGEWEPLTLNIGDSIQFYAEVERTIGQWLADGPADFHSSPDVPPAVIDYDRKET